MFPLLRWIRTSTWAPLVVRACLLGVGLAVLAMIGARMGTTPKRAEAPDLPSAAGPLASLEGLPVTASIAAADDRPHTPAPTATDAGPDAAPPPDPAPTAAPPPPPARASPESPVHLNEADATELRRLPGVGAKRAEAILGLRGRLGRFHRVEELLQVKGVGRGTLKKWRPLLRIDAPTTPRAPAVTPPRP